MEQEQGNSLEQALARLVRVEDQDNNKGLEQEHKGTVKVVVERQGLGRRPSGVICLVTCPTAR